MVKINSISEYRITNHARFEMNRRQITESDNKQILSNPEQIEKIRSGRSKVSKSSFCANDPIDDSVDLVQN